jgi:alpha-ribazole phosphatase
MMVIQYIELIQGEFYKYAHFSYRKGWIKMRLIFLRHGQTEWNALQRYQGQTDIPLNDNGRQQAKRAAEYLLKHEEVQTIYCSDLSRTRETAEIAAHKLKVPVYYDSRFREASFGIWEGMTFSEVFEKYPEDFNEWYRDIWTYKMPEGETFSEVLERVCQAIREIIQRHSDTVLVVTHGGVVKTLLGYIDSSIDIWKTGVDPGSMTFIEYKDGNYSLLNTGLLV